MSNVKIVLLNAPPSSGKTTLAQADYSDLIPWQTCGVAFGDSMKRMVAGVYWMASLKKLGFTDQTMCIDTTMNYFENNKDTPLEILNNKTPREFYITFSEKMIKPFFGIDYFGQLLKKDLERRVEYRSRTAKNPVIYIVSDARFYKECQVLVDWVGKGNVRLVRIEREGCDWGNDSGDWLFRIPDWGVEINNQEGYLNHAKTQLAEHMINAFKIPPITPQSSSEQCTI